MKNYVLSRRVVDNMGDGPLLNIWKTRHLILTHQKKELYGQVFTPMLSRLGLRKALYVV